MYLTFADRIIQASITKPVLCFKEITFLAIINDLARLHKKILHDLKVPI
jgi:hypothetical protein